MSYGARHIRGVRRIQADTGAGAVGAGECVAVDQDQCGRDGPDWNRSWAVVAHFGL